MQRVTEWKALDIPAGGFTFLAETLLFISGMKLTFEAPPTDAGARVEIEPVDSEPGSIDIRTLYVTDGSVEVEAEVEDEGAKVGAEGAAEGTAKDRAHAE